MNGNAVAPDKEAPRIGAVAVTPTGIPEARPSPRPAEAGRITRRQMPAAAISTLSVLFLTALWVAVSTSGWLPQGYLPTPREMGGELQTLFTVGYKGISIWQHIGISLFRTLTGFVLGIAVGIPLGLVTGYSRVGSAMVSPIMAFIRPIPPIAFIPMVVLYFGLGEVGKVVLIFWTAFNYVHVNAHAGAAGVPIAFIPMAVLYFGLGEVGKVVLIFWAAFNYVYVNAHAGAAGVPIAYQRAAQSIGLTPTQTFFRVVPPSAIPQIFTGLKVAMALSWAVVVAAELTGAQSGLGYMISDAALTFRIPAVFIGIALIGLIGLLLNVMINIMETWLVHWKGR